MPRVFRSIRIADDVHEGLSRLAHLNNRAKADLIRTVVRNWESAWEREMTVDEWTRYLSCDISSAEAKKLKLRGKTLRFAPHIEPDAAE